MKPAQARNLAPALEAAGLLVRAHAGKNPAGPAHRKLHGTAAVEGAWTHNDTHHAVIVCEDVAAALIEAGRWTPEAIRACRHAFGVEAAPKTVTRKRCTCACVCGARAA